MQAVSDPRVPLRRGPVHSPVEKATADGKTMIRCAGARCASWNPRPFPSRREAEFWYDRHIRQPLTHQLW
jgi:hypothetical protein